MFQIFMLILIKKSRFGQLVSLPTGDPASSIKRERKKERKKERERQRETEKNNHLGHEKKILSYSGFFITIKKPE